MKKIEITVSLNDAVLIRELLEQEVSACEDHDIEHKRTLGTLQRICKKINEVSKC